MTSPAPQRSKVPMPVIAACALLVGGLAGYFAGAAIGQQSAFDQGKRSGLDEARAAIAKSEFLGARTEPTEAATAGMLSIAGVVVRTEQDALIIAVPQTVHNPLDPQAPTERRVRITGSTVLVGNVQKDSATFRAEMDAFQVAEDAATEEDAPAAPSEPPKRFTERAIKLSEIKPGMTIIITAAEDITTAESFDVVRASVDLQSAPPEAGAPDTAQPAE